MKAGIATRYLLAGKGRNEPRVTVWLPILSETSRIPVGRAQSISIETSFETWRKPPEGEVIAAGAVKSREADNSSTSKTSCSDRSTDFTRFSKGNTSPSTPRVSGPSRKMLRSTQAPWSRTAPPLISPKSTFGF